MSGLKQAIRNIWGHGDDEYAEEEENSEPEAAQTEPARPASSFNSYDSQNPRPSYGGAGASGGVRRLRPVAPPMRAREKNIYTLRPKSQEDAAIAADALKAGDAVIINLEEVERMKAVRIIDFMSGVCYGLEGQGHAMKLGDLIFLYTPPEFEITSDETDYGENPDFFFKDVEPQVPASSGAPSPTATITNVGAPVVTSAPLHAQRETVRTAPSVQAPHVQAPQSSIQSTAAAQPIPSQSVPAQPIPQQTLSPQSYASGERRPWER